ncbi:hypothetical protein ACFQ0B_64890 [Nonomuraea thailandensis]
MEFALRLAAYAPNGGRLGVLPQHSGFELGDPLNDVPSLKVTYPDGGLNADLIAGHCEVAVEYAANGGSWVEPPNARFLRIKRSGDSTDRTGSRSYDLPGWAWMLRKVVLYPNSAMVDGKRQFNAVSSGEILATFIQEGKARGALTHLEFNFSLSQDSDGKAWAKALTLAIEPGKDLLSVLINLGEQGVLDWRMQGRELQVFNPDTVLGKDRASGPAPVDLRLGRDVTEAPDTGTLEDAVSAILIGGEAGLSVEVTNEAAVAPWGRWETYQSQSGVSDVGTARLLGENALERVARERVQVTRGLMFDRARWLPFEHYQPGDYVLAPGDGGAMESLRLRQITLSVDTDGQAGGNVVLNDRFLEREIRLARQAAGILDGGVGSGGSGGEPAPETNNRTPAAPQGLVVDPVAYLDENGFARGQVTASWAAVNSDVAGVALSIDGYELYARVNTAGSLWMQIAVTDETTATFSPLVVGTEYAFKVRATSAGMKGDFSGQVVRLIPDDAIPPPVPTQPQLTTRLGVIHVGWDGRGVGDVPMPSDFSVMRVWMQDPLAPGAAVVGHLDAAGSVVVPGQPYGADREFWFTALDRSGNESAESEHAVIATQPLVDTDLIGAIIDGAEHIIDGTIPGDAKITANTITGRLIQASAIQAGHIQANAVEADKIAAGAIQAGHIAANAVTAGTVAAGAITANKLAATAIDGKTITGSNIRTSATGRRIDLQPPGASVPEMRFYPSSGTNYTSLATYDDWFPGEATFEITSGTNQGRTAASSTVVAAGFLSMQVKDSSLSSPNGGLMEIAEGYARYGYFKDAAREQYFWFDNSGRTRHVGKWWDYTQQGNTAGVFAGSVTFGSGQFAAFTYGATMASNMGPVCTMRDGAAGNSGSSSFNPNAYWCVIASSDTGFTAKSSTTTSKAYYFWSHRH